MNSYSVKLKANFDRVTKDGLVPIYLQVIINRDVKLLPINIKWPVDFFDKKAGLLPRLKKDKEYNDNLLIINNELTKINEVFKIYRIQDKPLDIKSFLLSSNMSILEKILPNT